MGEKMQPRGISSAKILDAGQQRMDKSFKTRFFFVFFLFFFDLQASSSIILHIQSSLERNTSRTTLHV